MSTLQNQGDIVSATPQDPPSLHDETVVQRLRQSHIKFYNEAEDEDEDEDEDENSNFNMEREDMEKVTGVKISKPSTRSSDIHLLRALPNLEEVRLEGELSNEDLATVLVGISGLEKVKTLKIFYCHSIPPEIGQLIQLQKLMIGCSSSLTSVPPEIGQLIQLQTLTIGRFPSLTSVPPEIGQLIQLQTLNISECESLTSVPPEIGQLIQLQTLKISQCFSITSVPPEIGQLIQLQTLWINKCPSLTSVPPEIGQLIQLQNLYIRYCSSLTSIPPEIGQLTNLQELEISDRDSSTPLSFIILQALPPQCSINVDRGIFDELKGACVMSGSMKELPYTEINGYSFTCDKYSFKRKDMDQYFDWLRIYPIGASKLQMLANKANQRAVTRVYLPEGAKYNDLKRKWDDILQEDE